MLPLLALLAAPPATPAAVAEWGVGSGRQGPAAALISNVQPRRDTTGAILNAHDGALYRFDPEVRAPGPLPSPEHRHGLGGWGRRCRASSVLPLPPRPSRVQGPYVLVGTSYAECEGFTNCSSHIGDCGWQDNNFSAYSSPDLRTWTLLSDNMLPHRPKGGANFRPKVLRNSAGEYVMWFNYQPPTPNIPGWYTVATATRPEGPYTIVEEKANVSCARSILCSPDSPVGLGG